MRQDQKYNRPSEYHTFVDYPMVAPGIIVPQAADNRLSRAESLTNVQFVVKGLPTPGLRLGPSAVLPPQLANLQDDGPIRLLYGTSELIIRIMWPGYPSWDKRITAGNSNAQVPLAKFAALVAGTIQQFLEDMSNKPSNEARSDWWISQIGIESLVLLEVRRTGPGTWQPMLCRIV
ncbi:uncharacterized protein PHACADRAFT_198757 [Phanerochaete carnosa HHB-10118-sp]|uniref:Uncharacterized protein n=1 Tax=Phanerochaete carnosa (strain HHB-10118-sp) TaxID=650164 RepID=K5WQR6_PHACS|nr:uncharacterized protein PHACADRAFT_198757 [Phanerochaete carnosa HHB-10118-sp]EKM52712.1 hypothetical protein PHACADRAFT_198757 [Phanerochaete carnosa HHB-10118-sp]